MKGVCKFCRRVLLGSLLGQLDGMFCGSSLPQHVKTPQKSPVMSYKPLCVCLWVYVFPSACVMLLYVCLFALFCVSLTTPLPTCPIPYMSLIPVHNFMGRTSVETPIYSIQFNSLLLWRYLYSPIRFAILWHIFPWWVLVILCQFPLWQVCSIILWYIILW